MPGTPIQADMSAPAGTWRDYGLNLAIQRRQQTTSSEGHAPHRHVSRQKFQPQRMPTSVMSPIKGCGEERCSETKIAEGGIDNE
jgi:hypothetical protein